MAQYVNKLVFSILHMLFLPGIASPVLAQQPAFYCVGGWPRLSSTTDSQVYDPTVALLKLTPKVRPGTASGSTVPGQANNAASIQTVRGINPAGGKDLIRREGQCEPAQPPPAAREAGLTKLAFCDDFSTDTLARGTTPESRDLINGKKWTTERATRFGTLVMNPASDFSWNADGTLLFRPSANQYQWAISSTVLRNGVLKGYFVDKRSKGFYAEIRWRMDKRGEGQPAFWSMDTCHLYGSPESCSARTPAYTFLEPDFWEYYDAVTSLHYYSETRGGALPIKRCNGTGNNAESYVADGQWFVAGSLITPGQQAYYKDDQRMDVVWNSSTCPSVAFNQLTQGQFPLLIGSKMDDLTIDYVRVWEHPND